MVTEDVLARFKDIRDEEIFPPLRRFPLTRPVVGKYNRHQKRLDEWGRPNNSLFPPPNSH